MARTTPVNTGYTIINGSVTGTNGSKVDTWIEWKVTGTSVTNNTSTVRMILYAQATQSLSTSYSSTENYGWVGYDNGNKNWLQKSGYDFSGKQLITFADHSFTITHNNDGTKTITMQGGWSTNGHSSYIKDGSVSGQVTLPQIARASTISNVSTKLGTAGTVTITRQSNSFTHTLTYTVGGSTTTIATKTADTSVSFTPPVSLISSFGANSTSLTGTITCTTYSGNTSVGTSTSTLTLTIPSSTLANVSGTYGTALTLTATNACSSGLTYTFAYYNGSSWQSIASTSNKTQSWTPATSLIGNLSNSATGTIQVRVITYRGTASINTATANATLSIPKNTSSAISGTIGTSLSISISKAHTNLTSTITYAFGNTTGTIATKTSSTSQSWTPATSLLTEIPNSTSGTGTITIQTFNGTASVGSNSYTLTLSAASSVVPTSSMSATMVNSNSTVSGWGIYLQGYSQVKLTLTASGVSGSTISNMAITGTGVNASSTPRSSSGTLETTSSVLSSSGTITYTGTASDSRGRSASNKTQSITIYPYSAPSISSISLNRADSSGNLDNGGTYLKVVFTNNYSTANNHNTVSNTLRYREKGASSWTNYGSVTSGANLNLNLDVAKNYEAQVLVSDALNSNIPSTTTMVASAARVLNVNSSGSGLGIGGFSTEAGTFQEYYPAKFADIVRAEIKKFDNRQTSNNITPNGKGGMSHMVTTESMTGTPISDGHIIHMGWDNSNGYDSQFFVPNNTNVNMSPQYRIYSSGAWSAWISLPRGRHMASNSNVLLEGTAAQLNDLGIAYGRFTKSSYTGDTSLLPTDYGVVISYASSTEWFQIYHQQPDGAIYYRGGNGQSANAPSVRPWTILYGSWDYTTTYNGLNINVRRRGHTCRLAVSGTATAQINTSGAYVTVATLDTVYRPVITPVEFVIYNNNTFGQFNVTSTGEVRIGYTRDFTNTNKNITSGTAIYLAKTYEVN